MVITPNFKPPQIQSIKYTNGYSSLQTALDSNLNWGNNDEDNFKGRWGGGVTFHPAITLSVSGSVTMSSNNSLVGAGKKSSLLTWKYDNSTDSGIILMPSYVDNDLGMVGWWNIRHLALRGNGPEFGIDTVSWATTSNKTAVTIRDDPYIEPLRPELKTYMDLTFDDIVINKWGGCGVNIHTGAEGWGGFNHMYNTQITEVGHYGVLLQGDQRPWTFIDTHLTAFGKTNANGDGIAMFSQFPLYMANVVAEVGPGNGSGINLQGVRNFVIDVPYFETLRYGIIIGGNGGQGRVNESFFYGVTNPFIVQNVTNVKIDGALMQWCGNSLLDGILGGCEMKRMQANNNISISFGTIASITDEPLYIEQIVTSSYGANEMIRGSSSLWRMS